MKRLLYPLCMAICTFCYAQAQNEHDTLFQTITNSNLGLRFRADVMPDYVLLQWQTGQSDQAEYFELYRSSDGRAYNLLRQFDEPGTQVTKHAFSFRDENPLRGKNFYRLVAYDRHTQQKRMVELMADYNNLPRKLKPTLVLRGNQLRIDNYDGEPMQLVIYNAGGAPVMQKMVSSGTVMFPADALPAGTYVYNLHDRKRMLVAAGKFVMF